MGVRLIWLRQRTKCIIHFIFHKLPIYMISLGLKIIAIHLFPIHSVDRNQVPKSPVAEVIWDQLFEAKPGPQMAQIVALPHVKRHPVAI